MKSSQVDMSVVRPPPYNPDHRPTQYHYLESYSSQTIPEALPIVPPIPEDVPPPYTENHVAGETDETELETITLTVPDPRRHRFSLPETDLDPDTREAMVLFVLAQNRAPMPNLESNLRLQTDHTILLLYSISVWCDKESLQDHRLATIPIITPLLTKHHCHPEKPSCGKFVCGIITSAILAVLINIWGVPTFFHEYFGHLLLGGNLLTEPKNRYSIKYPSPYYQVDGFDLIRRFWFNPNGSNFLDCINPFNNDIDGDGYQGYASFLHGKSGFSRLYTLWGKSQSLAWISLSGIIPNCLLTMLVGRCILPLSLDNQFTKWTMGLTFYIVFHCINIQVPLDVAWNYKNLAHLTSKPNDFENWAIQMNLVTGIQKSNIAWLTALYLLTLVPLVNYAHYLYRIAKPSQIMDKFSTFRYAIRHSDKSLMLPYFRDVFMEYPTDYWKDELRNSLLPMSRPNNPILTIREFNLQGLFTHLHKDYLNGGFKKLIDLHFTRAEFPIHEKIPCWVRKLQGLFWVFGISGPLIHAAYYSAGENTDHVSRGLLFLPLLAIFMLFIEFSWCFCHQARYLKKAEYKYSLFEALGYLAAIGVIAQFIHQYNLSELSNMWGGSYYYAMIFCLLVSFHSRYQRTHSLVQRCYSRVLQ